MRYPTEAKALAIFLAIACLYNVPAAAANTWWAARVAKLKAPPLSLTGDALLYALQGVGGLAQEAVAQYDNTGSTTATEKEAAYAIVVADWART